MARLILFLTLLGGLAIAAMAAFAALRSVSLQEDANGAPPGLPGLWRLRDPALRSRSSAPGPAFIVHA